MAGINKKYNQYEIVDKNIMKGTTYCGYDFYFSTQYYDLIKQYCWHKHNDGYLRTCIGRKPDGRNKYMLMHKLILEDYNNEFEIDHINGKPNDNTVQNLRIISHENNMKNCKIYNTNLSGQKGVYYDKRENKWKANIGYAGKQIHLGTFANKDDAIVARLVAEKKYYGEYSRDKDCLLNGTR